MRGHTGNHRRDRGAASITVAMLLAMLLLLSGCSANSSVLSATPTLDPALASAHSEVEPSLLTANSSFAFELFSRSAERASNENLLISPASVNLALAILYNGAAGETRQALAEVLGLKNDDLEQIDADYETWALTVRYPHPETPVDVANALWVQAGLALNPAFVQRIQSHFDAEVQNADFADPAARQAINEWARQATQGRVNEVIDEAVPEDLVLLLVNTIYFKGRWTYPFDPLQTREREFTTSSGEQVTVPMMSRAGLYGYFQGDTFQAVQLPYGSQGAQFPFDSSPTQGRYQVSMYLFLPHADSDLEQFMSRLNQEDWDNWLTRFQASTGTVEVPRFGFAYEADLVDSLTQMGMASAFDGAQADFSAMFLGSNGHVGQVNHKTAIDVNEEGTEAAGLSYAEVYRTARIPGNEPFEFVADHPFFFAIRDDLTGTILFMGALVDPGPSD